MTSPVRNQASRKAASVAAGLFQYSLKTVGPRTSSSAGASGADPTALLAVAVLGIFGTGITFYLNYRLIADEAQARGTVNHTPVYPREVVKRSLDLHATALILVHNHPSGDPTPSPADVEMTGEVKRAGAALSIVLHDHVIIGNGRWFSFRREGLLD